MGSKIQSANSITAGCQILMLAVCVDLPCIADEVSGENGHFQSLLIEFEKDEAEFFSRYQGQFSELSTKEKIEQYEGWPGWTFIARVAKSAEVETERPDTFDSLLWVVNRSFSTSLMDKRLFVADNLAIDLLGRHFAENPRIIECFESFAKYPTAVREQFLRNRLKQAKSREVRGLACLALAELLRNKRKASQKLWFDDQHEDPWQRHFAETIAEDYKRFIRDVDTVAALEEARKLLEHAIKEYGDVDCPKKISIFPGTPSVSQVATFLLYRIEPVSIGKPVPNLLGRDLLGGKLSLTDYRGKVVVLSLWTTTCRPCIEKLPHLQELADRYDADAFAVLGINCDSDQESAVKFFGEQKLSWPSWYYKTLGGQMGYWAIDGTPLLTLYVLDQNGVVRYRDVQGEELDNAVSALLRARKVEDLEQ